MSPIQQLTATPVATPTPGIVINLFAWGSSCPLSLAHVRELLAHRARLGRTRTAVINELHAVYAKRNIEVPGMIWHRVRPIAWRAEELSGYAPRIVSDNAELLKLINQQIQNLDKYRSLSPGIHTVGRKSALRSRASITASTLSDFNLAWAIALVCLG
jgi:hypothetical protein